MSAISCRRDVGIPKRLSWIRPWEMTMMWALRAERVARSALSGAATRRRSATLSSMAVVVRVPMVGREQEKDDFDE